MSSSLPYIAIRLPAEYLDRWKSHCASQGMTSSDAGRRALFRYMGEKAGAMPMRFMANPESADRTRHRQEVRLSGSEIQAIGKLAAAAGVSRRKYIVNLIRSHLLRMPQLGMHELAVVGESNKQLAAIRSLLNQIAKKLNSGESVAASTIERALSNAESTIYAHIASIHPVIRSNLDRWAIVEASSDND